MDVDNEAVGLAQGTEVPDLRKQSGFLTVFSITEYALCDNKFTTMRLPSLATRMSHSTLYVGVERTQKLITSRCALSCHGKRRTSFIAS